MFSHESESKTAVTHGMLTALFYTAVFDTLIALLLTLLEFNDNPFLENFIVAQCIGLSICLLMHFAVWFLRPAGAFGRGAVVFAALILGSAIGSFLGFLLVGLPVKDFTLQYGFFLKVISLGILFGIAVSYFVISKEWLSASSKMIQEERIKRLSTEKEVLKSHLKLLQAQIEPHFLFNTLSNILSLMDTDLDKAKAMQLNLIQYLRTSLRRSRDKDTTLFQEMELIRAYLEICKIRLGNRLRYTLDIPKAVGNIAFPPMLIQPLVENAVMHGLEPQVDGGEIVVRARENSDSLMVEVSDTGSGMMANRQLGVGLSSVQERLKQMFGDKGRLILRENVPSGVIAVIEMPPKM